MKIHSQSFAHESVIPGTFAFAVPPPETHVTLSANHNPHLAWSDAPAGTRSFALICHDPDVPSSGEDVNKEGRTVPATLPRVDFFHWVLVDLPATCTEIAEGAHSAGVTARGKSATSAPVGRHGLNDYTGWFAGDAEMGGDYHGYDGPCPPWNDAIVHHYHFTVLALDVETLTLPAQFTAPDVRKAAAGHILDKATLTGLYTLNPSVKP